MPEVDAEKLREKLLDRRIEAIKEAVQRARTAWSTAIILTLVAGAVVFNATLGYVQQQVDRRADILGSLEKVASRDDLSRELNSDGALRSLRTGAGELGYLKRLLPKEAVASETPLDLDNLRDAAENELNEYVGRRVALDSVQMPLIGVTFAASDIGIVGAVGLIVVGYWLLASMRRMNHAFGEFVRKFPGEPPRFTTDHSGYSESELAYAYHSISQHMVFSASTRDSPINHFTLLMFLAPAGLMLANHLATAVMIGTRHMEYFQARNLVELILALALCVMSGNSLMYHVQTVRALQYWGELVRPSPVSRRVNVQQALNA